MLACLTVSLVYFENVVGSVDGHLFDIKKGACMVVVLEFFAFVVFDLLRARMERPGVTKSNER